MRCRKDQEIASSKHNALHKIFLHNGWGAFVRGRHGEQMVSSWLGARDLQHRSLLCKNRSNTHRVIAQIVIFSNVQFGAFTYCGPPVFFEIMKVILGICVSMRGFRICPSIQSKHSTDGDNRRYVVKNCRFLRFFRSNNVQFGTFTFCFAEPF